MTMMVVVVMMMMPEQLCYVRADPLDRGGRGWGGYRGRRRQKHTHKQGPAGSSEDRDRPELNSTLQIGAAAFQVEQSGGAPHR